MNDTPGERFLASVTALKPEFEYLLEETRSLRGDLVWLAVCGVEYDYAAALRRIEAAETAIIELLNDLARLNR